MTISLIGEGINKAGAGSVVSQLEKRWPAPVLEEELEYLHPLQSVLNVIHKEGSVSSVYRVGYRKNVRNFLTLFSITAFCS